jgi:chorismate mutase
MSVIDDMTELRRIAREIDRFAWQTSFHELMIARLTTDEGRLVARTLLQLASERHAAQGKIAALTIEVEGMRSDIETVANAIGQTGGLER